MISVNKTIRSFYTLVLLLLFTFALTPKQLFHYLFVGHKDAEIGKVSNNCNQYNTGGFNCQIETQIIESPFVLNETQISNHRSAITIYSDFKYVLLQKYLITDIANRGPPELI